MTNLPVAGAYTGAFRDPGRRRHRADVDGTAAAATGHRRLDGRFGINGGRGRSA